MTDADLIKEARELLAGTIRADHESEEARGVISRLADALEAHTTDEWEYQCKLPTIDPAVPHDWVSVEANHRCPGRMRKRLKAGPWIEAEA